MSVTTDDKGGRKLTGRAVLIWLLGFFGLVFGINFWMAYEAINTFPGLEVESSYKAGQMYGSDVAAGQAQAERAWKVDAAITPAGADAAATVHFADKTGAPIDGLTVSLRLVHAVDPTQDHAATLAGSGNGSYAATLPKVPDGEWDVTVEATRDGERLFLSRNHLRLDR